MSPVGAEPLSPQEFQVLVALADHPGLTLGRARMAELIGRGDLRPNDRMIDVIVGRLRKKIEQDPANPDWILTIHGEGYRLVPSDS